MQYPGDDIDPAMFELPGLGFFETLGMLAICSWIVYLGIIISVYIEDKNKKL